MKISRRHLETGGSSEVSCCAKTVGMAVFLCVNDSTAWRLLALAHLSPALW